MSVAENSVRADLEAAMKAHAEPEVETEVAAPPVEVETTEQKEERARDEQGRFVAKDAGAEAVARDKGVVAGAEADKPAKAADPNSQANGAGLPQGDVAQQARALAPPNGWTAEAKAVWHTLPKEVQEAAIKREQDVAKFTSKSDDERSFGREIRQAVQPYMAMIQAEGSTPAAAVQQLLNTAYVLRSGSPEQTQQALMQIAQTYGIQLPQPGQQQQPQSPLEQRLAQIERATREREQAELNQKQQAIQSELSAFAAEPEHQFFETVKAHMAALLREGAAKDLQDAYDQAVWANPETRATLLAQQRADEEQKRKAEAQAKAVLAKRKNVSITGGPGSSAPSSAPVGRSIREELEAAVVAHSGGAV